VKIGLRVIKTGIGVFAAILISDLIGIERPFYVVIASIIVMQPTVIDTWKFGMNRMIGTLMGAFLGVLLTVVIPYHPLFGAAGVMLLIAFMNRIKRGESIAIGSVVFVSVYLNRAVSAQEQIFYAVDRLGETFLGIVIAVVINYVVFPPNYDKKVISEVRKTSEDLWKYILALVDYFLDEEQSYSALDDQEKKVIFELEASEKYLDLQKKEEEIKIKGEFRCRETVVMIQLEREVFQHLQGMHQVLQRGLKRETVNLVRQEMFLIKEMLGNIRLKDSPVPDENSGKEFDLSPLIEKTKELKNQVKNNEHINEHPTEEMVKLIVYLYNLEQSLSKLNLLPDY